MAKTNFSIDTYIGEYKDGKTYITNMDTLIGIYDHKALNWVRCKNVPAYVVTQVLSYR